MPGANPAGETVEGNVSDLDLDAKFFVLEDRTGKAFIKIYWKPAHDEKMRKQKVGYYEAPLVTMEEKTGGLQEATLIDLPFKDRGDFPRMQKTGGSGGGWKGQPRNEKPVVFESVFKTCADLAEGQEFASYDRKVDAVWQRAKAISLEIIKESGC